MISDWIVCLHEEEFLFRHIKNKNFMRVRCCYIKKEKDTFIGTINFKERVSFYSEKVEELVSLIDTFLRQKGFEIEPFKLDRFSQKRLPKENIWLFIQNNIRKGYYE